VFHWPKNFKNVPNEPWAKEPLEALALKYDSVENHGWYKNLDNTVDQIRADLKGGEVLLDYSGGTGILADRILNNLGEKADLGILIVDSSPKFLRLAVEKLKDDSRVAFRLMNFIKKQKRLELLHEVVDDEIYKKGVDILSSTNAIHLYYNLKETLKSWQGILRDGGKLYVQSGNIRNPKAPEDAWIIDESVIKINEEAIKIVSSDKRFEAYRDHLKDLPYMEAHDRLREKYFLPVRSIDYYQDGFKEVGFEEISNQHLPIEAKVDDWYEFLNVYHEGILGWVGGSKKITGKECDSECINVRKTLIREAMTSIFGGKDVFKTVWNYFIYQKKA
jgi:ubiquinone/menaquinone biosynthesis C-methylase UbiE